jgi:8-oxo-dGTP diphosphatase
LLRDGECRWGLRVRVAGSVMVADVFGHDGDGWARCGHGHRHWGRFGAVGLLARAGEPDAGSVLLVRRARWSHYGGTWAPPGGARGSDEPPLAAALREGWEECGLPAGDVTVTGMLLDDHGGWSYRTFVVAADGRPDVRVASPEITDVRWVDAAEVESLPLHPGFAPHWPVLRAALVPVTVIVDGANVMGARADGWWRDRAAAIQRLHGQLAALSERGVAGGGVAGRDVAGRDVAGLPGLALPPLTRWFPGFVLVVEGAARRAALGPAGHLRVVAAAGSGDDAIVAEAKKLPDHRLVVTADRELRRRCQAAGVAVTGPGWLLGLLT